MQFKQSSIQKIDLLIERYPALEGCRKAILGAFEELVNSFLGGGKILACGNGGSSADSDHLVGELAKGFILPRKVPSELAAKIGNPELSDLLQMGLPAISLSAQTALCTAISNDQSFSVVYAQQVLCYGKAGDVLICISTSGNSRNCVNAAIVGKAKGLIVVSLTGQKESRLSELSDITIQAPSTVTSEIQEYHLPIYHAICLALENEFFG